MMVRSRVVLVALTAVALGACGSSDDSAPKAAPAVTVASTAASEASTTTSEAAPPTTTLPDPCQLVSKADAVQLAGTALDDGVKAGTSDNMSCTYVGPPDGPTAQVEFFVGDGAKKFLDVDRDLGHTIDPLPGVGDEAYIEEFTLFFRTGTQWNVLRLTRLDDFPPYRQPMIDLATKVATKS
jgi:hypothetical protein